MAKVMLIGDRWAGNMPGETPALSKEFIEGPLFRNASLTPLVLRYDEWAQESNKPIDLEACAPTVMLHTDAIGYPDADHSVFAPFYTAADRHVSLDNPRPKGVWEGTSMDHTRWSWVPAPSNPDILCDPDLERTIPISHVGTLKAERITTVKILAENDTERSRIAEQGHQYVMEKYGEDKLWKHLLGLANSTSESKEG